MDISAACFQYSYAYDGNFTSQGRSQASNFLDDTEELLRVNGSSHVPLCTTQPYMVGELHVPYNSIGKGLFVCPDTVLGGFEPSSSCSSLNTQLLSNFCGSQMQSQPGVQNMMPHLHSGLDVFKNYSDLYAGSTRPQYTAALKGTTLDVQRNTLDCLKCKSKIDADSDVFETYFCLCAQNIRPWCSSNLPQAEAANNFGTTQNTESGVFQKYTQLCARNVTTQFSTNSQPVFNEPISSAILHTKGNLMCCRVGSII
ncbi:hypothetical protein Tco_1325505 [Tanacetum coccineum]